MVALGDSGIAGPNAGNHLRWGFNPRLGFPPAGFDLYRRPRFAAPPTCVDFKGFTPNQNLRRRVTIGNVVFESERDLFTAETVAPQNIPEMRLSNMPPTSIWLPEPCTRVRVYVVDRSPAGGTIQAVAFDHGVAVSADRTVAAAGVQILELSADRIDRVAMRATGTPMNGVLTQVCYVRLSAVGQPEPPPWTRLNQRRICLPLSEPLYSAPCGLLTAVEEWPTARTRIPRFVDHTDLWSQYGPPSFIGFRDMLAGIYDPSADLLETADVSCPVGGHPAQSPKFLQDPLGIVLLASLDPYIARMLGLYWIDGAFYLDAALQSAPAAEAGQPYDYRLVAHYLPRADRPDFTDGWDAAAEGLVIDGTVAHGPLTYSSLMALSVADRGNNNFALQISNNIASPLRLQLVEPIEAVELVLDLADENSFAFARAYSSGDEVDALASPSGAAGRVSFRLTAEAIDTVELGGRDIHLVEVQGHVTYLPGGDIEYIAHNVTLGPKPALGAPARVDVEALPVLPRSGRDCRQIRGQMAAGIRWDRDMVDDRVLPGGAVLFDIQRQRLGSGNAPIIPNPNAWTPAKSNVLVASRESGDEYRRPPGWPYARPDHIDAPPDPQQRWYAYRVRGTDLFGRQSSYRESAAADLADIIPPPPPTSVRAKYLDPTDPQLSDEERTWTRAGGQQRHGIHVSWRWLPNLQAQAPDVAQYRVYLNTGRLNVITGNITAVSAVDQEGNVTVTTDAAVDDLRRTPSAASTWRRQAPCSQSTAAARQTGT